MIDILVLVLAIAAGMRGFHIGLVRQAGSTIGFVIGVLIGSWINGHVLNHIQNQTSESLVSLVVVIISGLVLMTFGELIGLRIKLHLHQKRHLNIADSGFGSIMAGVTVLFTVWLLGSIILVGSATGLQQAVKQSQIINALNTHLPPASQLLSSLNTIVDPNSFPEVFRGLEPHPGTAQLPSLGLFDPIIQSTRSSVVRVEGAGCGGIVEGSGFVVAANKIVTNAHVVAGVRSPKVIDSKGTHDTRVVWFDTELDLAVLEVNNLAGKPLMLAPQTLPTNTPAVILGYPGGGAFDAQAAAVMSRFTASGRNIYGQGNTLRDVYALQAHVIPGNSGGPVVGVDGKVIGIVFATSSTYNNVGYALTSSGALKELAIALQSNQTQLTGACSEI